MYVRGMGRYRGMGEVSGTELTELIMIGMGRYRRGLGQVDDAGVTPGGQQITIGGIVPNCPGDLGCPGNPGMIATPLTAAQLAALSASNAAYFNQPATTGQQSITQWLNANSTAVLIAAGALVALAALK